MTENGNMYMPVAPMGNSYGGGDGMFGGGWMWFLLVWMAMFGWGGNGWGGNGNNGTYSEVQRGFDQNALVNGLGNIQNNMATNQAAMMSQLQTCCCENRAATADLKYTIALGNQEVINNDNRNYQGIMDKLCALELDGVKQQLANANDTIGQLRTQLLVANNQASQNEQTARILANNEAQTTALEQYLAPTPRPAYIVQNPNCCSQNYSTCTCGM